MCIRDSSYRNQWNRWKMWLKVYSYCNVSRVGNHQTTITDIRLQLLRKNFLIRSLRLDLISGFPSCFLYSLLTSCLSIFISFINKKYSAIKSKIKTIIILPRQYSMRRNSISPQSDNKDMISPSRVLKSSDLWLLQNTLIANAKKKKK